MVQAATHGGRQENIPTAPSSCPEALGDFTSETNAQFIQVFESHQRDSLLLTQKKKKKKIHSCKCSVERTISCSKEKFLIHFHQALSIYSFSLS